MIRSYTVKPEFIGRRLDLWLAQVSGLSRKQIKIYFQNSRIRFIKPQQTIKSLHQPVMMGDEVAIDQLSNEKSTLIQPVSLDLKILYEDPDIAVLHKDLGITVHPGPNESISSSLDNTQINRKVFLVQGLLNRWPSLPGRADRAGLVHRLDRQTEGLMVIAKTSLGYEKLVEKFAQRRVKKRYLAWAAGYLPPPHHGKICTKIRRNPKNRLKMMVSEDGKIAETTYRRMEILMMKDGLRYYKMEISPKTGRTHQIRVHLAHLGIPVVNDFWYGQKDRRSGTLQKKLAKYELMLLAQKLEFSHPRHKRKMKFSLPSPERFKLFEETLRNFDQSIFTK